MKTFSDTKETPYEDAKPSSSVRSESSDTSLPGGLIQAAWKTTYWSNGTLRKSENQVKHPQAPTPLNSSSYGTLSEMPTDFSWKTILKQYLISTL